MKVIPVPHEPGDLRELLGSGYDINSINQRYKEDLDVLCREYSMMALLKGNANVVYCDDIFTQPNPDGLGWKLYIRMELLTPLTNALEDPCSEAQVVKLGMDLCNALVACKREKIIHRDIKPANIMVAVDGHYKLGDFGVAKTMEKAAGGTKTGTYNFMAPEVYNNHPYDHSADLYSLGMVLYWMLNRRCGPFLPQYPIVPTAAQMEDARDRRFRGEPLPAPACGSPKLQQVVLRACAYDPANRHASPEELYDDLAQIAATLPIHRAKPTAATAPSSARSNTWQDEQNMTQGTQRGSTPEQSGTMGGTVGDGQNRSPYDVRAVMSLTAQELASGCVKPLLTITGRTIYVTIKPGTLPGTTICVRGSGKQNKATGAAGDTYITLTQGEAKDQDFWKKEPLNGNVPPKPSAPPKAPPIQQEAPKKKVPWGAIIWIGLGFGMLTVVPPLGIGWIALGIPFLFIGRKK